MRTLFLWLLSGPLAHAETLWLAPIARPAVEASCAVADATGTFQYHLRIEDPAQLAALRTAAGAWGEEGHRPRITLHTRRTAWTRAAGSVWTAPLRGQVRVHDDQGHEQILPLEAARRTVTTHAGARTDARQEQTAAPLGAWARATTDVPAAWLEVEVVLEGAASARCDNGGFARARLDVQKVRLRF